MAVLHGKQGSVLFMDGTTARKIANTTNWTVNAIQETAESRVHEADWGRACWRFARLECNN